MTGTRQAADRVPSVTRQQGPTKSADGSPTLSQLPVSSSEPGRVLRELYVRANPSDHVVPRSVLEGLPGELKLPISTISWALLELEEGGYIACLAVDGLRWHWPRRICPGAWRLLRLEWCLPRPGSHQRNVLEALYAFADPSGWVSAEYMRRVRERYCGCEGVALDALSNLKRSGCIATDRSDRTPSNRGCWGRRIQPECLRALQRELNCPPGFSRKEN